MLALFVVLLLALILFGVGFALKVLWWAALAVFIVWLVGLLIRTIGTSRYRWHRH